MTDLDDAFVEAAVQSAFEIDHRGTDVLLRAPEREEPFEAKSGDDEAVPFTLDGGRDDVVLEVVVDDEVVGLIVPVDDGFGVLIVPEDGEEPSRELETVEDALDELGI
ncbi:hypothetical protein GCM10027515_09130 [Schumannella luteola]|uniref:DUF1292 domain-containing protein n=1 Tax=Schumannella luteola TaxID=472059 RepID=A0A852Y9A9_9MICO|nr:hypothetical protein [Schumannella luteola]NYG97960.1 hypothetical protein [Schumannella luteola]TPX01701.1 hypothetical protein FJ656_25190 [Schumannella luteola]